jgi:antitoxin CptB
MNLHAPAIDDARLRRLRWRCRRGPRELDGLLAGWLEQHGPSLDEEKFAAFDALLDQQDPDLWDWLMGHAEAPRVDWRAIVADIRQRAGLAR